MPTADLGPAARPEPLSVAVVGPGAVGGLVGALLARAGHDVVFVARPATARALDGRPLAVRSHQLGDFSVDATARSRLDRDVDVALVAVKAPALGAAIDLVAPARVRRLVVPLLNGIDHLAALDDAYGAGRVAAGAIRVEAARASATSVDHLSPFLGVDLAGIDPDVAALAAALRAGGAQVSVRRDRTAVLWDKLAFLAPFALSTAAHDVAIGDARTEHRSELEALAREAATVARSGGATTSVDAVLALIDAAPATMSSSLRRDLAAGAPDELDAIGGAVVRWSAAGQVAVPVTRRYVELAAARRRR